MKKNAKKMPSKCSFLITVQGDTRLNIFKFGGNKPILPQFINIQRITANSDRWVR